MNKNMLRSIMVLHGDTNKDLAACIGKSEQTVTNKINENGTEFVKHEIKAIAERYNLTAEQIRLIFFD